MAEDKEETGSKKAGRPSQEGEVPSSHLLIRLGGQILGRIPLRDELRIGRGEDNDLVLPDSRSSRYHARIYRKGDHYMLGSLSGSNHAWVNGISLIGQRRLRDGDRIILGDVELVFQLGAPPSGESAGTTGPAPAAGSSAADAGLWSGELYAGERAIRLGASGKPRRRRLAYNLTPVGVVVLLILAALAAYFLMPGLYQPQTPTPEPSPTPTAAAALPSPTAPPAPTPSPAVALSSTAATVSTSDLLAQAQALVLKSRFEEAMELYQTVAREYPNDPRPEIGWAWALILDGLPDQALLHARRASELAPQNVEASVALARAYVEMKQDDDALTGAQKAVRSDAESAEAHAVLALALLLDGRYDKAVEQAEIARQADPLCAEARRVRGLLYQLVDADPQQAAVELREAAQLQPDLWLRHHELGLALLQAGEYDGAILSLTNALVLRHKAATFTALGRTYYQMGEYDQAKSFLEQSLSAGAWDADTYALLAALNAQQSRCQDARVYYEQALQQDPAHPLASEARITCEGALPATAAAATTTAAGTAEATATQAPPTLTGQIAFPVWNRDLGHYDTYLAQADGSDRWLVAEQMHQPALRPDGQWLAVNGERPQQMNLCIVRPDGSDLQEVSGYNEDSHPAWSPDGQGLVLDSTRHPDRQWRVYVIDQVAYDGNREEDRTLHADTYELLGQRPAWMDDGRIVYNGCDHTVTPTRCGLFAISAEPGPQTPQPLTGDATDTAPAAYGDRLAFMSMRDGNWEIYLLETGATEPQRLTRNTANDGLPVWSPDGQTLAFVSDQGGVWAVWAMNPDGSQRRKLFDMGGGGLAFDWQDESISWAP